MAGKIVTWTPEEAEKELKKRLQFSQEARSKLEHYWKDNEKTVYSTGYGQSINAPGETPNDLGQFSSPQSNSAGVNINYSFKNLRFLHAQMSANPPSVLARPASNDPSDKQKADAADRLVRYGIRHYLLQEYTDKANLNCLTYGTGFLKTVFDPHKGDILEFDQETGEVVTEGDICITVPNIWDVYIDSSADDWADVRYVFERITLPYEEALFRWPEHRETLDKLKQVKSDSTFSGLVTGSSSSFLKKEKHDIIEVFEYWEKGMPSNAYLGRYAVCTKDGKLLEKVRPSPFRFKPAEDERASYEVAYLPYHCITDIDIPNQIWGKSVLDYVAPLQDTFNRLDSLNLDNIQAHGVTRLVIPETAEISDDSITNSPWDVIKITGNQGPHFFSAPPAMPQIGDLRAQLKIGIDDIMGVNEAMMGQQSREQSGALMQYASNQGNMIRRRIFNKYAMFVESIYRAYLNLIRKHWTTARTIKVIGKEKALEAIEIKGADISGGYDLQVEYGQSLSLDPMSRREEIMALQPIFEKAGVAPRVTLKMLKLNELEGLYDMMQLAEDRQREIFEEMIASNIYIPPEELQDHDNMLAYAMQYLMTTEYKYLPDEQRLLIKQHIKDRAALAAQEKGGMPGVSPLPGAAPGGPMSPGPNVSTPQELPPQEPAPAGAQPAGTPPAVS